MLFEGLGDERVRTAHEQHSGSDLGQQGLKLLSMGEYRDETEGLDVGRNAHASSRIRLNKVPGKKIGLGLVDARIFSKHSPRQAGHIRQMYSTALARPGEGVQPAANTGAQGRQVVGKRPEAFEVDEAANTCGSDTGIHVADVGAHAVCH
ncbi:hypothetical protein D9M71_630600 [compost metagenome]